MVEAVVTLLLLATLALAARLFFARRRRIEARGNEVLALALAEGQRVPLSLHPVIDPALCVGSFSCVKACPEGEVIGVVDGVATLVQAAHCIGHGTCADECPVGAIKLVFGDAERGVDLPEVDDHFTSSRPGVFIVGELGGMGLIKNALRQGLLVGDVLKKQLRSVARGATAGGAAVNGDVDVDVDVVIVGAGPAGIAAAIACKRAGLRARVFEQETVGGAVAHYPRGKVVMTEQIRIPGHGPFGRALLTKEELMAELAALVEKSALDIREGQKVTRIDGDAPFFRVVTSSSEEASCRAVVLAIGLRGTPRKLNVAGEELPKVTYRLVDPEQYHGRAVLVVGGGDSAVEAAIQLAEQSTAQVTICHRGKAFTRCKSKNRDAIQRLIDEGRVRALFDARVQQIDARSVTVAPIHQDVHEDVHLDAPAPAQTAEASTLDTVVTAPRTASTRSGARPRRTLLIDAGQAVLALSDDDASTRVSHSITIRGGVRALGAPRTDSSAPSKRLRSIAPLTGSRAEQRRRLRNDDVIVSVGGELPSEFLRSIGVSARRYHGEARAGGDGASGRLTKEQVERRSRRRLAWVLFLLGASIIASLLFIGRNYYWLPEDERLASPLHALLRPSGLWGHGIGMVATTFMLANFIYAARKRWRALKSRGSIRTWLTFHMFVGLMSPLVIAFHSAFLANSMLALWTWASLAVVVATGVFGRFLFGLVPTQTGKMLAVGELREQIVELTSVIRPTLDAASNVAAVTQLFHVANQTPKERTVVAAFLNESTGRRKLSADIEGARGYFRDDGAFATFRDALLRLARARVQISFYASLKRIFRGWLVVHVVLALFMVILIGAHVAVATWLGFGAFFVGQST